MDFISIVSVVLAIPSIVLVFLSQISFWQQKEYRFDRVLSTVHDGDLLKRILGPGMSFVLWSLAYLLFMPVLALVALVFLAGVYLVRAFVYGVYRPRPTKKSLLLGLLVFISVALHVPFLVLDPLDLAIRVTALILLIYPVTALMTAPVNLITRWKKRKVIAKARKHRESLESLQVIGITGSYGKTTTKHFLSEIITDSKASKEHRNSDYVIALDLLEQVGRETEKYIVEMSAYKKSEVAALGELVKPDVGIITHIGNQHYGLFGSRENILEAKWELIDSLPEGDTAVLNADDELLVEKAKNYNGKIIWYSSESKADVFADNVSVEPRRIVFSLHIGDNSHDVELELLSEAYLDNVLAAAAGAYAAGVDDKTIVENVANLKPLSRTMEPASGVGGSFVIDDSYSANESSVVNAVRHLSRFEQKDKRVVMVPLIELGGMADEVHGRIGKLLKESGFDVYVYGRSFHDKLGGKAYAKPDDLIKDITQGISEDTVILIEGRVPAVVRRSLMQKHE